MARTTATEVKAIMDNCTLSDTIIDAYITAANAVVTDVLGDDTDIGSTLLDEIEKWYSAHLVASTTHRQTAEEQLGDAKVKYAGQYGKGLEFTSYGQVVLQLDTTGKMSALGKRGAKIRAINQFDD